MIRNIRGFSNPLKLQEVSNFLCSKKVNVVGLLKVKVKDDAKDRLTTKLGKGWNWVWNTSMNGKSRIMVGFRNDGTKVDVISIHPQFITCRIIDKDIRPVELVSFIYGFNTIVERKILWEDLKIFPKSINERPWAIMGDFSFIFY